ncbi:hypothetical protein [Mesonia sp. HuA40]|uniref:hypothetical protein n=1 Tax=Mesonia sp. HuA40 TaxID=2602761 RepID=UPI0011CAEF9A|nr:hypothetical protein [Mesonia sp. HuA40]TXK73925.1 hypothetical protein FT993_03440 [Mesonia sp. HuA40]
MNEILKIVKSKSVKTGNKSGITDVQLAQKAGYSLDTTHQKLNQLHQEAKVIVREGINRKLIFSI